MHTVKLISLSSSLFLVYLIGRIPTFSLFTPPCSAYHSQLLRNSLTEETCHPSNICDMRDVVTTVLAFVIEVKVDGRLMANAPIVVGCVKWHRDMRKILFHLSPAQWHMTGLAGSA